MVSIPKPKRRDRPNLVERRNRKRRDKAFQIEGETHWCIVGHEAEQTCWHHLQGRRNVATRWDTKNCIRLCYAHHSELHQIGESFYDKYPQAKRPDVRHLQALQAGEMAQGEGAVRELLSETPPSEEA